ncbi:DNA topoisomerase IV subunit A [Haloplasma contractile]|uniref:DNA topoisomerase 4 subunit A n=1 Tax=Haloplasma contractile SSD-17B TaxID=1033810 RepID=U2EFP0_9MOLU|nr:DNA topoisomerase IV subunit A [Haloplasma contractile]ERJ13748.1 DNA topoisomerase 4 subunit A protein [Haloplasma contractile SSD-17B]
MAKIEEINRIIDNRIESVLGERFALYSKYIIQDRALPDVRDGLKPVQRRILYAMYREKNTSEKNYRKSAKTVGVVIGNYHPHGDSSVYEAMVRLSQDWKVREPLVDMHGNKGSIDGDPPAAMRYTEARLSKISNELLKDIDKHTVEFAPNFDDTELEPTVLPSRFPNLLVNGSTGISAGYATDIPPHNITEVINAVNYRLKHPDCSLKAIMRYIKGPDFPTGGIVQGLAGIEKGYKTGKGKIVIKSRYEVDDKKRRINITEIPFEVNKSVLLKKIEDIRIDKKVDGIAEVRDETDQQGLRIAIDYKKDANVELIINYLLKNTHLQVNYNFNMTAIHNKRPVRLGILEMLDAYIEHQKDVTINRSNYELNKAKARLHILDGLVKMVSVLDDVIRIIRKSNNKSDAKNNLIEEFKFSEEQAEAIVTLQLYRLSNTDVVALEEEARKLTVYVTELEEILSKEDKLITVITNELNDVKKNYKSQRRTDIEEEIEEIQIDKIDMIKQEDVILTITREGYIKTTKYRTELYKLEDYEVIANDYIVTNLVATTIDTALIFTNKGNYIYLPLHQIAQKRYNELGQHINELVRIEPDEKIMRTIIVKDFDFEDRFLLLATKNGYIKRTAITDFNVTRYSKTFTAIKLKGNDDALIDVSVSDDTDREVIVVTKEGYMVRYPESEISISSTKARGVKSLNLKDDDEVVAAKYIYNYDYSLCLFTHRGHIKKVQLKDIQQTSRGVRGNYTLNRLKRNNHLYVGAILIHDNEPYILETTDQHQVLNNVSDISHTDLNTNGSKFLENKGQEIKRVLEITTDQSFVFDKERPKSTLVSQDSSKNNKNNDESTLFNMNSLKE